MASATNTDRKPTAPAYPALSHPAAGTAYSYPYAAGPPYYPPPPPPAQNYYGPYHSNPSAITPARRCFRVFIIACVVFFLVSGIITLIVWLVLRPQAPTFAVSSASASAPDSSSLLSGDFDFALAVRNPNKKMSVDYRSVEAFLEYGSATISGASLPPFSQGKRSETVLAAKFPARDRNVSEKSADGILKEKGANGDVVSFRPRVYSRVTFWWGGWRTRRRSLRAYCDDVRIRFGNSTSSGSMVGSEVKCRVDL